MTRNITPFNEPHLQTLLKMLAAETLGTCLLTLAALLGGSAYAVGLTLGTMVYCLGSVSGCHLNPAVTVGLVSLRKMPVQRGVLYIIAQIIGALIAAFLAAVLSHGPLITPAAPPALGEILGIGFLFMAVIAVVTKKVPDSVAGVVIGGGLTAGLLTTGGILNPAVAVAMNQTPLSSAFWGPILGAILFSGVTLLYAQSQPSKS